MLTAGELVRLWLSGCVAMDEEQVVAPNGPLRSQPSGTGSEPNNAKRKARGTHVRSPGGAGWQHGRLCPMQARPFGAGSGQSWPSRPEAVRLQSAVPVGWLPARAPRAPLQSWVAGAAQASGCRWPRGCIAGRSMPARGARLNCTAGIAAAENRFSGSSLCRGAAAHESGVVSRARDAETARSGCIATAAAHNSAPALLGSLHKELRLAVLALIFRNYLARCAMLARRPPPWRARRPPPRSHLLWWGLEGSACVLLTRSPRASVSSKNQSISHRAGAETVCDQQAARALERP